MTRIRVRTIDPAAVTADQLDAIQAVVLPQIVASAQLDQPWEPALTAALWRTIVSAPWSGDPAVLVVAHDGSGDIIAHAVMELPAHDNQHAGLMELHAALEHRRQGVGRALVDACVAELRARGRRTLIVEARVGSPTEALFASLGGTQELIEVRRHQPIADVPPERLEQLRASAGGAAEGYPLEVWGGPAPNHLVDRLALALMVLNDAPMGGLDYDDEVWDAARIRRRDQSLAGSGLRMTTVLALAPDGSPAGYTEIGVNEDGTYAWQWGTAVAPAHRGHRLGLLLKVTMAQRLRATFPDLRTVCTFNAETNRHMIAVNEALGYVPVDRMGEWQIDVNSYDVGPPATATATAGR